MNRWFFRSCLALPAVALLAFGGLAHASPAGDATRELKHYNADEEAMAAGEMLPAPKLFAHWKELEKIASALSHVRVSGLTEGERVRLRHELSQALGQPSDVASVKGDYVEEKVQEADEQRKQTLVKIARWANQHLDFEIVEVLGVRVATAGSSSL
jgi:hypothetical protein